MPGEDDDFRELMCRIREGSEDAAWELVERYGEAIRRTVRRALNRRLRPLFDSLDFVQLVWSSFFRVQQRAERFAGAEDLAAFLAAMARNKVGMETRRRLSTQKYNLDREDSLEEEVADHQPAPIEVAIAREQWDRIVSEQPEHYRQVVQLRLQGHTHEAIAEMLQLHPGTVRRILTKLLQAVA